MYPNPKRFVHFRKNRSPSLRAVAASARVPKHTSIHVPLDSVLDSHKCGTPLFAVEARAVANTDNFAQASWPRLGEMSRGLPRVFYASCRPGDQTLVLSERMSRLGGEGLA
ncbi:hypothetical protein DEO72_LG9g251 [Vigna unguiculata]|uniref:Uncharacterized protein n=1 Tax=Vigna unguiculata TaxID=3917 RepID=A0A4D6MVX3_VIGUN|nr:hypothetical protein DEO72_LG9g251 [Vigna unguiculata]